MIGRGPEVLRNINVLGNDFNMGSPGTCGKDGQPTLRVRALTVDGTAA